MSYRPNFREGAVAIPEEAVNACGDLLQLRLLCLLCSDRALCEADESIIAERLLCSIDEVRDAAEALRAVELLKPEKKLVPSAQSKNLTGEQIAAVIDENQSFRSVIDECETICGKVFTPSDISKIVSLKRDLGLDGETIVLMFFYYAEKLDAAGGKKLSVSYVEKAAYSLYNQGITTYAGLEKYIKMTEERNSLNYRLRRLFGTGDRAFTKKEKGFFEKWSGEWKMPFEMIEYAFEITVNSTGKPHLDYMSKILSDWHSEGIMTVEAAEKRSAERKEAFKYKGTAVGSSPEAKDSSFDTDEFFEKALKRSYAMLGNAAVKEEKR